MPTDESCIRHCARLHRAALSRCRSSGSAWPSARSHPGARVEVRADDAAFEPDLRAWARQTGHAIVALDPGAVTRALVEKA
jgi:hypothetical protein